MLLSLTGCSEIKEPTLQTKPEEELEDESEEIVISENDFSLEIGTLPYRGAVLFINYWGEVDLTDYDLVFDVISDGEIKQENMPVEEVDGEFVATIVDLMYLPGDELDFVIRIQDDTEKILELYHSEALERYPWKDWMFNAQERVFLWSDVDKTLSDSEILEFVYEGTDRSFTPAGAHASWDFYDGGKMLNVYSGTVGVVYMTFVDPITGGDVRIYNPHVGAIVQYGHLVINDEIVVGKDVEPGDHLGNVLRPWDHVHYSVIRPYSYVRGAQYATHCLSGLITEAEWEGYYWPKPWDIDAHYNDPFYWHEPTTLGYWYEETLPPGLKEEMIAMFQRDNPDLVLPVMEPSGGKLTYLEVAPGSLSPNFTEGGSAYTIAVDHSADSIDIKTILSDTDATMEINGQPARSESTVTIGLNEAGTSTEIAIIIAAADGKKTRSYNLTVNRAPAP